LDASEGPSGAAKPRLSVVVPIFDEEDSLEPLHRELDAALSGLSGGVEFVLVDDGSRDGSLPVMRRLAAKDPRVRVIALDANHGQSAAFEAGFAAARGELIATLDADLQNDPADIPRMIEQLEHADVVNGVRADRQDDWVRKLSSKVANRFRNRMTRETVTDVGCSLRVMRASFATRVNLLRGMHRFLPTLLRLEGARVSEMPVAHRPRRYGESKYGIGNRLFVGLVDVFAVRWMQRRHEAWRARELPPAEDESTDGQPPPQPPAPACWRLAAGALHGEAACLQQGDHLVAVVALDLDHALLGRAAAAAAPLELACQLAQRGGVERHALDRGHGLPAASLHLAPHADHAVAGGGRARLLAAALAARQRHGAVRADASAVGRVDGAGVVAAHEGARAPSRALRA
jgi:dolichol-phosphate mannosyltransferase